MLREIVVVVEAAVQSWGEALAVENYSPNERGSMVALLAKPFRQCCVVWRKRYGKVGDAVGAGQKPGEDCSVRSIGDRAGSECLREAHPIFCECVRCGRFNVLIAIAVKVVGSESIDGDQKDIGRRCFLLRKFRADGAQRRQAEDE